MEYKTSRYCIGLYDWRKLEHPYTFTGNTAVHRAHYAARYASNGKSSSSLLLLWLPSQVNATSLRECLLRKRQPAKPNVTGLPHNSHH